LILVFKKKKALLAFVLSSRLTTHWSSTASGRLSLRVRSPLSKILLSSRAALSIRPTVTTSSQWGSWDHMPHTGN